MTLKSGQHVHLMGICGTAMASLAGLLKQKGFKVTGSDQNPYPPMSTQLENLKIPVLKGYQPQNLSPHPDFVVVGNVISANNLEAQELVKLGIPYTSLPQAMGEWIIKDFDCICISGTHGKTTTTSLMAWILNKCGESPGFLIGGIPQNFGKSFELPQKKYFVIEGDEYDTAYFDKVPKFTHYHPKNVILTSVEFDHADIYSDLNAVLKAFEMLVKIIPPDGNLIYWSDDKNIKNILPKASTYNTFSYGLTPGSDYLCRLIKSDTDFQTFEVFHKDTSLGSFKTSLSGEYNLLNCTACVAQSHQLKLPFEKVKLAMESFLGVRRRQEIRGEPRGILVIEDFAHHPTAVRETIRGIKNKYQNKKVFAVFEPRSATSRRRVFQKEYVNAFLEADVVLLAKAFDQSKIQESDRFSSEELVSELSSLNKEAAVFLDVAQIIGKLKESAKPGDLILIMSNGGFDGIYEKLLKALETPN